ncbi:MAG: OmpA family protein [bacterium]|nr:OmpA family protein [bacterium]
MNDAMMKKMLIIAAFVVTFILGVMFSELILRGFNGIFGSGTFDTKSGLRKQIEEVKKESEQQLEQSKQKYDQLSGEVTQKQANMNSLLKDIETKINPQLIKDLLLTTPSSETGDKGKLFLDAGSGEGLLKPSTTDDPTVNRFKQAFNQKAKDILDVSKNILGEKVGQLNKELLRINDELKDRNVEVISKLRQNEKLKTEVDRVNTDLTDTNQKLNTKIQEVEKANKEVDRVNSELTTTNQKLSSKIQEVENANKEVDRVNSELKTTNQQLEEKLQEVDRYKKELEDRQQRINDLEGVKGNLEKTVGVLETKIEDGRLKVSFKGDILFESGKHELRKEGQELLDSVYKILKESTDNNDIFIAGHTDNVKLRPDARYDSNWTLSTYRAIEVVKHLVEKNLSPDLLTAAGYGEFKPIADNATEDGKSKNRRVELFLIPRIIKR